MKVLLLLTGNSSILIAGHIGHKEWLRHITRASLIQHGENTFGYT